MLLVPCSCMAVQKCSRCTCLTAVFGLYAGLQAFLVRNIAVISPHYSRRAAFSLQANNPLARPAPFLFYNPNTVGVDGQSILETIMDVFRPLLGMSSASPSGAGSKPRRTSFVDKAFTPFSGKIAPVFCGTQYWQSRPPKYERRPQEFCGAFGAVW